MREIAIDTETTGLNYKAGDRIIEVGCVEMINYIATGKTLNFYCNVEKKISDEAKNISGISNEFLKTKKTFKEQSDNLLNFIGDDTLIMHNAEFDFGFINNELKIIGKKTLTNKIIDTVPLARKVLNTRIANLDYLCRHFGIDISIRKLHGALLDAQLLAEVYLELRGGKQITMDLSSSKKTNNKKLENKENLRKEMIKISTNIETIKLHKLLIKAIKKPIWGKYNY